MLKVIRNKAVKCCYLVIYEEVCDTCDSKNNKTPVIARVRLRAREGDYRYFHNSFIAVLILLLPLAYKKTTCRFMKNKPSFYRKQAVVL